MSRRTRDCSLESLPSAERESGFLKAVEYAIAFKKGTELYRVNFASGQNDQHEKNGPVIPIASLHLGPIHREVCDMHAKQAKHLIGLIVFG